jgi:membrane protein implicated in regulation of membrane protease activity
MDWTLIAYWVCFGVGTTYAVVSALLGGVHGLLDLGGDGGNGGGHVEMAHDYGAGHGEVTTGHEGSGEAFATVGEAEPVISPLSPATLSIFLATFGGVGIILTSMFKLNLFVSLPVSAGAGVGVAGSVMLLFYHLFTKVQGSSEPRSAEAIGLTAEVTVPVPKEGVGEVAYVVRGARFVSSARSQTGKPLARHVAVRIVRQVGNTFYVEPVGEQAEVPQPPAQESLGLRD